MSNLTLMINADASQAQKAFQSLARSVTKIGKGGAGIATFATAWEGVATAAQSSTGALDALDEALAPLAKNMGKASRAAKGINTHLGGLTAALSSVAPAISAAGAPIAALTSSLTETAKAARSAKSPLMSISKALTATAPAAAATAASLAPVAGAAAAAGSSAGAATAGVATLAGALLTTASASKKAKTAMGPLKAGVKGAGDTAKAASDPFTVLNEEIKKLQANAKETGGFDGYRQSLQRLGDNVTEFGGSNEDAAASMIMVGKVAKDTGKAPALISNALGKMIDESDGAKISLDQLNLTLGISQKAMIKTEDAGSLMGRGLRGDTAILREMGGVSAKMADQIDKIPDPAKRTALIMAEVKRVAEGTAGATTKLGRGISSLQTDVAGLNSKLAATGIPGLSVQNILIGIAGAAITAAVAIGSKLKGAVDAYTNSAKGNTAAVKEMEKQTKRLEITIGGLVSKTLELEQSQRITAARTESLNNALVSSDGKLSKVALAIGAVITPIVALTPGLNLVALGFVKATGAGIGLSAGLDKLLGTSKALSRQLRTELVASTRMAMRALASLQEMLPTGLNAAANEGAGVAAVGRIAKNLGRAAKGARRGGGGGGGGGGKASEKDKAAEDLADNLSITDSAYKDSVMERARAAQEERRAKTAADFKQLNADLKKLQEIGAQAASILEDEQQKAVAEWYGNKLNTYLQNTTQSAYALVDALATGSLTLKEFGAASAVAGGDLIANLGMDIVSEAVGSFAQSLGSVFVGIGAGFEALASNPLALLGIGAGLVAAGAMLKQFGSEKLNRGSGKKADSSAANAVQALGRNLFAEQDREERTMNLIIGDYQGFRAMIRDTATTTGAGAPYLRGFA